MGILIVFGLVARASIAGAADPVVPDEGLTIRSAAEMIVEWLDGFVSEVTEMHGSRAMVPFFGSIFMFILFANFFGLIPGMEPPTGDSDLTFALGIRLYANMFADHTVLSIFTGLTYLVVPLAFYALGAIVCIIQAIIFMVLSMSYVRLAAGHDH